MKCFREATHQRTSLSMQLLMRSTALEWFQRRRSYLSSCELENRWRLHLLPRHNSILVVELIRWMNWFRLQLTLPFGVSPWSTLLLGKQSWHLSRALECPKTRSFWYSRNNI
ncbi:hypothetical protein IHE45_03G047300 [Dioscorea alata]|uniref:Uncharacterized protein n=1 Tax=Dioscorea alata TaxID=55571 RepID=A0ACB7WKU3_DIOAL|nr:hypothetical protein IHE45_03G047300 [Dioscorea alata]